MIKTINILTFHFTTKMDIIMGNDNIIWIDFNEHSLNYNIVAVKKRIIEGIFYNHTKLVFRDHIISFS